MQNNLNFTTANTPDKLPTIIFEEIAEEWKEEDPKAVNNSNELSDEDQDDFISQLLVVKKKIVIVNKAVMLAKSV